VNASRKTVTRRAAEIIPYIRRKEVADELLRTGFAGRQIWDASVMFEIFETTSIGAGPDSIDLLNNYFALMIDIRATTEQSINSRDGLMAIFARRSVSGIACMLSRPIRDG
jgi:hypothetical protein